MDGVIEILNRLVETCRSAEKGFRLAADNLHHSEYRRLLNILSDQRGRFVSELQAEVRRLGGSQIPINESGSFQKGWDGWNDAAWMGDEASIIAECQRGEEAALKEYEAALKAHLPVDVRYVVKRQYMDIKAAFDRIRIFQRAA